jgi:hypothetical protein
MPRMCDTDPRGTAQSQHQRNRGERNQDVPGRAMQRREGELAAAPRLPDRIERQLCELPDEVHGRNHGQIAHQATTPR